MSADWSEVAALAADLNVSSGRVGAKASQVVRKVAADVESDAKLFAPVDTGALRNSISTSLDGDGRTGAMSAEVGPTANYGAHVEFGTYRTSAQSYMGPAADRHAWEFEQAMQRLGEEVL